jgi:flagellar FliL protein
MKKYQVVLLFLFLLLIIILTAIALVHKFNIDLSGNIYEGDSVKEETDLLKRHTFEKYSEGGTHYVTIRDLVVSANTPGKDQYFKLDLTIVAADSYTKNMLYRKKDSTVAIVRNVISSFSVSDVKSAKGKEYLKNTIKNELASIYGEVNIEDVYFENFVYNN